METNYLISPAAVQQIISKFHEEKRNKEYRKFVNAQYSGLKELEPTYELRTVLFNSDTRITKLEFVCSQKYRTIDRYVTQNYVRYPVYSEWKSKSKIIKKTVKLTNTELEYLNDYEEDLIRVFASEIIFQLGDPDLYPSWFIKSMLKKEHDDKIQSFVDLLRITRRNESETIRLMKMKINQNETAISQENTQIEKLTHKKNRIKNRLERLKYKEHNPILSIITLFIYDILICKKRRRHLLNKSELIEKKIIQEESKISSMQSINSKYQNKISSISAQLERMKKKTDEQIQIENEEFNSKLSKVQSLKAIVDQDDDFISLKAFVGIQYQKVIGCYIIHNKEKEKYYVGQSKDVHRRLKQHFKGTIPNNIIFAEDYFSSQLANKEDLFEVKIIKCETKDELDRTEKELIEKYDSWNSGYNGTSGNS